MTEGLGLAFGKSRGSLAKFTGKRVRFSINTTPPGARIYNADGSLRGITPYDFEEQVSTNRKEKWTIRLDDYKDVVKDVDIKAGLEENITLEKDEAIQPTPKKASPPKKPASASKPKPKPKPGPKPGKRLLL